MIKKYKQYNEGIKHLLVGPSKEELYDNVKDFPAWKIKNIAIDKDWADGLRLSFEKDNSLVEPLITKTEYLRNMVSNGEIEIVKVLLDYGADPNTWHGDLLIKSVFNGNYEMTKLLLEYGADPDKCYLELINRSKKKGFDEISELLKQYSKKDLNESIKHLLTGPTEEQVLDNLKDNPRKLLQYSVNNEFKKGIELALEKGANIHILLKRDKFLLFDIMDYSDEQILDLLKHDKWDAMDYALHHKRYGIIKTLLNNGFEFQEKKKEDLFTDNFEVFEYINNNIQLIKISARFIEKLVNQDKLESIKLLIKMGCFDIYWFGDMIMRCAKSLNRNEIVKYLISINIKEGIKHLLVGPTDDEVSDFLKTLSPNDRLAKASKIGNFEMIVDAIESGANVHCYNNYTIRYVNIDKNNNIDIIDYLLKNGCDIHFENEYLLRRAVVNNKPELVKYLIDNGADIHVDIERPLKIASQSGFLEIVKLLLDNGAEVKLSFIRDAVNNGHDEIANILKRKYNEK